MLVGQEVKGFLEAGEPWRSAVFSAGCAERMVQIFTGIRGAVPERVDDVDFVVDLLDRLWDLEHDVPGRFADSVSALEGFPEMRPREIPHRAAADIYCFYAVLTLRYAAASRLGVGVGAALSCGHAALTATGQLDQNRPEGSSLSVQEAELQHSVTGLTRDPESVDSFRAKCQEIGKTRFDIVHSR